jgi:hypothetical protein
MSVMNEQVTHVSPVVQAHEVAPVERPVFYVTAENDLPVIRKFSSLTEAGNFLTATGAIDRSLV